MDINKKALAHQMADVYGYKIKDADQFIVDFMESIIRNLEQGNSISLHGFGCFDLVKRKAQMAQCNYGGQPMFVPEHYSPRFYPSANMKRAVKYWESGTHDGDD